MSGGRSLAELAAAGLVDPGWAEALEPVADRIAEMGDFLRAEHAAGHQTLPAGQNVLRAFSYPLDAVRVLIVGQDPYPTPGHPIGLSFAVDAHVRPLPPSLRNIYKELQDDLGIPPAPTGDLTPWAASGVMLLNRVLTIGYRGEDPNREKISHRGKGWEAVTEHAIRVLVERETPLVAILWGNDAQSLTPMLGDTPIVASVHPSPLSASRGFFGSKPFSRVNAHLVAAGADPVDWSLGGPAA